MKCEIRKWRTTDASDLATALNNVNIHNNLRDGWPFPYTMNDAHSFIDYMLSSNPSNVFAFAITVDDKTVGSICVTRLDNIHSRTAELGYFVAEPLWGKGICSEAIRLICQYVFQNTNIIRIFAEPFAFNAASCRILEKNGFELEGTLRANAFKNGKIIDMKMYSLVKTSDLSF